MTCAAVWLTRHECVLPADHPDRHRCWCGIEHADVVGTRTLSVADVNHARARIARQAAHDPVGAADAEARLHRQVLEAIADGADDPRTLAEVALATTAIVLPRGAS